MTEKDFDILFEKFIDYSIDRGVKLNYYDFESKIKLYLKAAMGEQLFTSNLGAQIKATSDSMLIKVQELDQPTIQQTEERSLQSVN